ncbi:MAG: 5'-methylthioadenosine/S-adenosylhomocysteine nucleosidase [Anaerolineales bacterium]|nr:5'-methylthioadenosine/S-adenosylhomocysteine nucleosidase [Anaerolineales bacterium]
MKTVVIISANAEWRVVKELYPNLEIQQSPFGEYADLTFDLQPLTLFHGGWGKISAAATAQYVVDHFQPELIINLGTCGGFEGRIERGTIILAEKTIVYDIIEQMSDSDEAIEHYSTKLDLSFLPRILPSPVLRGLLISADRDIVSTDIPSLIKKYNAVAADWESGAIAWVAQKNGVKCLILRGVTDLVSTEEGEAYGDYDLFSQRTKEVMRNLFEQLPKWQDAIEKVQHGYRGY